MRTILLCCVVALCVLATAFPLAAQEVGDEWVEPITGMEFVWVPGGCYEMGCGEWAGDCYENEYPVHEVCVDGFWMGKYEVTRLQWNMVMGSGGLDKLEQGNMPIVVSRYKVSNFLFLVSFLNAFRIKFRLPTEAEWEYACRSGGLREMFSGGREIYSVAWFFRNSDYKLHDVGTRNANGLGIHDMSGNAWEWTQDWYSAQAYTEHEVDNPVYCRESELIVVRGGSVAYGEDSARCSSRIGFSEDSLTSYAGFRLVFSN